MAIIILCRKCRGRGRIKTKIPYIKKRCSICNGKGKLRIYSDPAGNNYPVSLVKIVKNKKAKY